MDYIISFILITQIQYTNILSCLMSLEQYV